jgi:hypothetical protein
MLPTAGGKGASKVCHLMCGTQGDDQCRLGAVCVKRVVHTVRHTLLIACMPGSQWLKGMPLPYHCNYGLPVFHLYFYLKQRDR